MQPIHKTVGTRTLLQCFITHPELIDLFKHVPPKAQGVIRQIVVAASPRSACDNDHMAKPTPESPASAAFPADSGDFSTVARQLCWTRYAGAFALTITIGLVQLVLGISLPLWALGCVVAGLLCCNIGIDMSLRHGRDVSAGELFAHLLLDVCALAILLYFSGGSGNPFVSFFLLPLVVAAVTLPARHAVAMALLAVGCYTALMFFHWPLPSHLFNLHVLGMWFNFLLSAALILGFVVRLARNLRQRDAALASAREKVLRDEHIVALGALAAGAAHDLGTPLSTMAVLAKESETEAAGQPELADNMRCLGEQIASCKQTLARLRNYDIEQGRHELLAADAFLGRTVENWSRLRAAVPVKLLWQGEAPQLRVTPALVQTLSNLINNAADASPDGIEVEGRNDGKFLVIDIRDDGPGISEEVAAQAGRQPVTTKHSGHGVGLLLANATIERLGGRVSVSNRTPRGACTRVSIPLAALASA